jgi:hypothetical protein
MSHIDLSEYRSEFGTILKKNSEFFVSPKAASSMNFKKLATEILKKIEKSVENIDVKNMKRVDYIHFVRDRVFEALPDIVVLEDEVFDAELEQEYDDKVGNFLCDKVAEKLGRVLNT